MADPISPSESFSFQSNKIGGPPNSASNISNNISNNASTPSFPFDNTTRSIPNSKFSLKILSPSAKNKKKNSSLLEPTLSFGSSLDELAATPKTRGITRLKKTSAQYTNQEFTKRLSIPSFHVADQILMDLLTEQNNTAMNTIDEDEIDDEDNMDILDFIDDEDDDDYNDDNENGDNDDDDDDDDDEYDDDEIDSLMTLNAFPDLPDFGSAQSNGSETTINSMGQISTTPPPRNKTLIPTTAIITQSSSTGTPNVQLSDLGSEEFRGFNENEEDDFDDPPQPKINADANVVVDDDEDEMLTPRTYQNLFKSFHKHDMEKEIQRQQQEQIDKEQAEDLNVPTPNGTDDGSFDYNMDDKKEDNNNNYGHHQPQYSLSSRIGMKINVSQFKSDDEPSISVDGYDGLGPTGFSGLQHSTSLRFTNTIRKSRTYSEEESQTIINNDGMGNTNSLRMQAKQKKLTAAESAILVAKVCFVFLM